MASTLSCALSASLYGGTAVSLAFVNKAVLTAYAFKEAGAIELQPFSFDRARSLAPIALLYCSNTAFALASLEGMSIPMYTVLKRLTPAFVLAAHALNGKLPSRSVIASVVVTLAGCVLAGAGDLAFDLRAYAYGCASCALQTAYLLAVGRAKAGLSSWELLLYNSLLSAPILTLLCLANGEANRALRILPTRLAGETGFAASFLGCIALGCLLNYAIFLCTRLNSALTTTIVGVLKGVFVTILGFIFLGGVEKSTSLQLGGVALNTFGGVWYAVLEYQEKEAKRAATQHHVAPTPPNEEEGVNGNRHTGAPANSAGDVTSIDSILVEGKATALTDIRHR